MFFFIQSSYSQEEKGNDTIILINPSLEGEVKMGSTINGYELMNGWLDCSPYLFPTESPADVHPNGIFEVTKMAHEGETYIGMVVRENGSFEAITQKLNVPLQENECYIMSLFLARSDEYVSRYYRQTGSKSKFNGRKQSRMPTKGQAGASIFRLYGGDRACNGDLLAETNLIEHTDWKKYKIVFKAPASIEYLTFSAFFGDSGEPTYRGNLLMDHISPIVRVACIE